MGMISQPQLYNLETDPGEQQNIASQHPEKVKDLHAKILEITGIDPANENPYINYL